MPQPAARPVYLIATGAHLPGPPISNADIDRYIGTVNRHSKRIRDRVLAENGIRTRHYGIDATGVSQTSSAGMAAAAIRDCIAASPISLDEVTLLATGTSGGDVAMPGFSNMVQGELGSQPMETSSHHGVCAAGVSALLHAHRAVALGQHRHALVAAAEFPSRMFKSSRFTVDGPTWARCRCRTSRSIRCRPVGPTSWTWKPRSSCSRPCTSSSSPTTTSGERPSR